MKLPRKCLALAFAIGVVFGALVARCWAADTGDGLPKIGILWIADAARIAPYVQPFKDWAT